jgi:hypothetical protein
MYVIGRERQEREFEPCSVLEDSFLSLELGMSIVISFKALHV